MENLAELVEKNHRAFLLFFGSLFLSVAGYAWFVGVGVFELVGRVWVWAGAGAQWAASTQMWWDQRTGRLLMVGVVLVLLSLASCLFKGADKEKCAVALAWSSALAVASGCNVWLVLGGSGLLAGLQWLCTRNMQPGGRSEARWALVVALLGWFLIAGAVVFGGKVNHPTEVLIVNGDDSPVITREARTRRHPTGAVPLDERAPRTPPTSGSPGGGVR